MSLLRRWSICVCLVVSGAPSLAKDETDARPANHLARESSPYLLHHAHNLVDWRPWGAEAFALARKEGKLVFLSSGYHACHWCHVMERESFQNPEVAALLNRHFVCIKIDREERPDVDHVYLTALNAMGQAGGWPLSMFLTADGKPIAGGTYWPPEDRDIAGEKVPGFKTILQSVIDAQQQAPDQIRQTADFRAEQTRRALAPALGLRAPLELSRELVTAVVSRVSELADPLHGGFGRPTTFAGPKFPRPPYLQLLRTEAARTDAPALRAIVQSTLEHMARGGLYDQVGGGFHRYAVERTWTVPHFEKMLSDNGQLLELYAQAQRDNPAPLFQRVLTETLEFVAREMTSPEGVFYTSLDADSDGVEGRYYVWTADELAKAAPAEPDRRLLETRFGTGGPPNFEERAYVLALQDAVPAEDEERWRTLRAALLQERAQRPRPNLDTKVLTSWNGLMIAGMAQAGRTLDRPEVVARAATAADFLLRTLRDVDGRLQHVYAAAPGEPARARLPGYLDDYTHFVHGLLVLHDVTGEPRWRKAAQELTDDMLRRFHDAERGGFFFTSPEHEALFVRAKDQYDGVQWSGNSQAAANLLRLWRITREERYRTAAEETLRAFARSLQSEPSSLAGMADVLSQYLSAREQP